MLLAMAVPALAAGAASAEPNGALKIAIVSRERLLSEAEAAQRLRTAEQEMTDALQMLIDTTRRELADEERELARVRSETPEDVFAQRVKDFDSRMRLARRSTQDRADQLQKGFQLARARLVSELPEVLEQLRVATATDMIIDADMVLAAGESVDITDLAIDLHNRIGRSPSPPDIDLTAPLVPPPRTDGDAPAEQ